MAPKAQLDIGTKDIDKAIKWSKELPERLKSMREQLSYGLAKHLLEDVRSLIPKTPQFLNYSKSLELFKIGTTNPSYGLFVNPTALKAKNVDNKKTILFVQPVRKSKKATVPKNIKVLVDYGPWTADTIPFMPNKQDAVVVARMVGESGAQKVRTLRNRDRKKWESKLALLGIKVKGNPDLFDKNTKLISDVEKIGASLEFGYGDIKAVPHWRPSLRRLMTTRLPEVLKSTPIVRTISDPSYTDWSQKKQRQATPLDNQSLMNFNDFAKKILTAIR